MPTEIRFLLVEDEPLILRQLQLTVQASNPHFTVVGTAANGRDGLRRLTECAPDIVITDIHMPVMSGLDMIAAAQRAGTVCRFVILTGYSEFEYARSALKLGVVEYALKPIDAVQLSASLCALAQEIDHSRDAEREAYLRAWFAPDTDADSLPSPFPDEVCYLFFASAGSTTMRGYGELSPGSDLWRKQDFLWVTAFETQWAAKIIHFVGKYVNEHVFAVLRPDTLSVGSVRALAGELLARCDNGTPIHIIATGALRTSAEFHSQILAADVAALTAIPFGRSGVCCLEQDTLSMASEILPEAFCQLAAPLAQQAGTVPLAVRLQALAQYWQQAQPCEAVLLRQLEYVLSKLKDGAHGTEAVTASELLADALSFSDVTAMLLQLAEPPLSQAGVRHGAAAQVTDIKRYIDENYAQPLTYRVLYERFGYNEKYIASLFKKELGITPSKYIVGVRIEAAKRLLLAQPERMQKEVAQAVGFADPLYFSRVFRDMTGVSPSRFAKEFSKNS